MKKRYLVLSLLLIIFSTSCTSITIEKTNYWDNCTFKRAYERSQEFVDAINTKNPEKVYSMLSNSYRTKIKKDEFTKRYLDDLSYPYISPLYCSLPKMGDDVWPQTNKLYIFYVEEKQKELLSIIVNKLREEFPDEGISAFVVEANEL